MGGRGSEIERGGVVSEYVDQLGKFSEGMGNMGQESKTRDDLRRDGGKEK